MESVSACRVLLVEDDCKLAQTVKEGLGHRGFSVHHVDCTTAATKRVDANNTDVIVLDLALTSSDALNFAAALRQQCVPIPVLTLTEKNAASDRIDGCKHGADDYLCKPIDVSQLAARLLAIMRRTDPACTHVVTYADVELDLVTRSVRRDGIETSLSSRESELLAYMIRHKETPLSREKILRDVWGESAEDDSNVLNVYVNYLRNKIDYRADARMIHTIRGVGYMLSKLEPSELAQQQGT